MSSKPTIVNVSLKDMQRGNYPYVAGKTALIRIADPRDPAFPKLRDTFTDVSEFRFGANDDAPEEFITDEQAADICKFLQKALDNQHSVVVHCTLGEVRSGSVVEAGLILGFNPTERIRYPSMRVVRKLVDHIRA